LIASKLARAQAGALFHSDFDGVPLRTDHVAAVLVKRKKNLPVADFTTHDLRRTFATQLAELGVPLDLIAAIVGHEAGKSHRTLVVHYVRAQRLDAKAAVLRAWDERLSDYVAQGAQLRTGETPLLEGPKGPAAAPGELSPTRLTGSQ
jgi:integrase